MNQNINIAWAQWLIEDCTRHGITHFCIAPGSRSTPLTLAVANHPKAISHCHFDERGLGFFALGLAKATQQTVAVITTSGSAVGNLYPVVIEAKQSEIPLLILSADRPHELLSVGANQAIEQQGIFAQYPVYQAQLAEPNLCNLPQAMLTELGHALAIQQQHTGPVHLNCPYREPFYPQQAQQDLRQHAASLHTWLAGTQPFYQQHQNVTLVNQLHDWTVLSNKQKVLVVIGQQSLEQSQAIIAWAQQLGWPIVADCQSHWQQSHAKLDPTSQKVISQAELLLANLHFAQHAQPDVLIQFGDKLISKRLNQWLAASPALHYVIATHSQRINPSHHTQQRWQCAATVWLAAHPASASKHNSDYTALWSTAQQAIEHDVNTVKTQYSELSVCAQVSALQASDSALFMGNSMIVRMFELLGQPCKAKYYFANRGASGIDGLVATTAGITEGLGKATTLVIGDTSLLHDLNSLALASRSKSSLTIVLFNNDGGEIFRLLPNLDDSVDEAKHQQLASEFYQLPHQTNFAAAAASFNLPYTEVCNNQQFEYAFQQAQRNSGASLIEVKFAPGDASSRYQALLAEVASKDAL
ncbi:MULTISPECIES: 2-succinyl-5-enolpyruvyl-6-hydroxy-3-cyclohexene-1-carboxylic-acid synthase [unclassified Agarivorans]|uniref:2-succinyl-5-enolpyruvyl-6-hydroxy-3- cyclohexene-1-carboxylic-acid synthase n=1 Tax=unclassified Agarivorans TaxID=2636026 RepID=UPI0026E41A4C|nr:MULTISPECIES: 2-succinyl-5-enolpyruvyl-6-hydroxy-3-cyclohexene-1-carboxylic-acid synthase [unclassified Agarivorans]MDO6686622.1 2-succinyl-5-enolpyruvyl-6-hydroxy-3-cyclohexene-1-carboxylic-acid synthase [Agarivorans sp. 3_MG-2023]MDO6715440.1 2-succinyl-5-enolpyruvyl-6-hydroxy-3-cyclohexene-1-carboxylic-acid synthase [Agarivorans sp. 2_MG-2023]